jgi:hypothetical protein
LNGGLAEDCTLLLLVYNVGIVEGGSHEVIEVLEERLA